MCTQLLNDRKGLHLHVAGRDQTPSTPEVGPAQSHLTKPPGIALMKNRHDIQDHRKPSSGKSDLFDQ